MENEIRSVLDSVQREIADDYKRIHSKAKLDPGSAGDKGEEMWKHFLESWLPTSFIIVTKGNIIFKNGEISPQIDILILNPDYPQKLLEKKIYYIDGVVAAFECKLTLTADNITEAMQTSTLLKQQALRKNGNPYSELHSNIIYGLLAQSHSWKQSNSKPIENIERKIFEYDRQYTKHPRDMIDVICVADLATWIAIKLCVIIPKMENVNDMFKSQLQTTYLQFSNEIKTKTGNSQTINPLCSLIYSITKILAKDFQNVRNILNIYHSKNFINEGLGVARSWDMDLILSQELKNKVSQGKMTSSEEWDDWNPYY